ncbi:hypothetical protein GQ53DRAFT_824649 [Thozetella sp. PMI_491]|nr:hypothetical protein GQ53DRAFT_824649 [Thozetella sp. PMI_491]
MKSTFVSSLLAVLAFACGSSATRLHPPKPDLTYLYTVNITVLPPISMGPGPLGTRILSTILSGYFHGPKLNGTLIAAGGDWNIMDYQGNYHPDVRQTFLTDDGAYIQVFETGCGPQADGNIHVHLAFETGSETYYWMNKVVGVGILSVAGDLIIIDAWQLLSPP